MRQTIIKILILGDGLLGTEIRKQTNWDYISRKKDNLDFCDITTFDNTLLHYDTIINCIACTDTYSTDKTKHWNVNYDGVIKLVDFCNFFSSTNIKKKLVHISTDYIYANSIGEPSEEDIPVHNATWYGYTKLLADGYIQARSKDYLLIRTSFKANPWKYNMAYVDQITRADYVDVIASLIIELINKEASGIYNVGTEIKSIYELAGRTKPEVKEYLCDNNLRPSIVMNIEKSRSKLIS